jgi:diaminohydroxyphosphoribosylaminopyrimidine deaminase/5-amino-6-(5-phosphoribosylamino)uracil reductase
MNNDAIYMKQALALAARARGRTSPNPMVGAVLVKNGEIVGSGWHEKAGGPHAEIMAVRAAGAAARGAALYVNLEPCAPQGRTGPCTEALIAAGVEKVFVAVRDPTPLVAGRGVERLTGAGIMVEEGLLAEEAAKLNEIFFKWIKERFPFVTLKYAMSLDGKIAAKSGDSRWISGEESRRLAHRLRACHDGVMIGLATALRDDPALTCRLAEGSNPVRIVVDSRARLSLQAHLLRDGAAKTIVAVTELAPPENVAALRALGTAEVLVTDSLDGRVDLKKLLTYLGQRNITSVLAEGGGALHASLLAAGAADKICAFIAPKIIGGDAAPGPVGGQGAEKIAGAWPIELDEVRTLGKDIFVTGYIRRNKACSQDS